MTNTNPLKERCSEILNTTDPKLRASKKVDLRTWIRDQGDVDLIELLDDLDKEELGISMICGLYGKAYNYAYDRIKKLKAGIPEKAEEQPTDKPPSADGKPSIDESKGFEQLDPELIKALVNNSNNEEVTGIAGLFMEEMTKRGLIEQPEVT